MENKDNWPRITIVTPSFNQGKFLEETIQSVLNQNYPNLEYFIVDGGSTDNSVDIIKKYEDKIDWWISEKDAGQSDALCKGFDRATGGLLGWLNSDDVYFPGALLKIAQALSNFPGASIYSGGIAIGKKGDKGIGRCSIPTRPFKCCSSIGLVGIGQQSSFFSAEAYRRVGGLKRNLYMRMDGDLFYRIMKNDPKLVVIDDMIGFFRWHETTKSTLSLDRYQREHEDFIKSLGISKVAFGLRKIFFRIHRLVIGGYIKSFFVTQRYKDMHMADVWSNAKQNFKGQYR